VAVGTFLGRAHLRLLKKDKTKSGKKKRKGRENDGRFFINCCLYINL